MYTNEKFQISSLEKKAADIEAQARMQGRPMLQAEAELRQELLSKAAEIRMQLPTGPAMTFTGPNGQGSYDGAGIRPFLSLAEQLMAVQAAGTPSGRVDDRLHQIRAAASGLNETVPSEGAFLLQDNFNNSLLQDVLSKSILAPMCRKVPIGPNSNGIKLPGVDETSRASGSRSGGITTYWVGEAAQITASKPKFRVVEMGLKKVCALCYATDELLQDSVGLEGFIRTAVPQELAFAVDDAIINGTGAGQPLGILNAGCLVQVAKETGQAADTILAENIIRMEARMIGTGQTAVWLCNKNVKSQLYTMSIAVGTGGVPIYMPAGGLSGVPYPTLFGRPVHFIEQAATLGDVGDILYADLSNGYLLAEKGGIQSNMSIHVRFDFLESVFRFFLRIDGQPVRAAALTPYKGGASNTESHFVALAERA